MSGAVPANPRIQFPSSTGGLLPGGFVDVFTAGTTTRATTWQDKALTTPNQNPIALDTAGSCSLWTDSSQSYDFVVRDANLVTQYTLHNIVPSGVSPTIATFNVDTFSGNGSQTAFTLSATPTGINNTAVYVGGVYQKKSAYSLTGNTVNFVAAPASGSNNVEVNTLNVTDYSAVSASIAAVNLRLYAGTYATAPTTRPDGSAIQNGDRYVNSTDGYEYIRVGGAWTNGANQAQAASASATAAQTARDAALAADRVYPDTTSGLAGTTSGQYFYVPSPNSGESLVLYVNSSGVASEIKRYTNGALSISGRPAFTALATPTNTTLPRVVEITADALHGARPTLNMFDGQTLRFAGHTDPSPATVLGTSDNAGAYNVSDLGTMFQDDYCQTPVTAAGQSVALLRDIRGMDLGAELVTIAGFGTGAGWTKSATTLTGTAASGDITCSGVGTVVGSGYWIEFDLSVSGGSVYAAIGLSTGPVFTTSGRKRFFLQHLSNTTAGFYFHPSAFTGSITNITCKKDSRNHLARDGVRALPVYQLDASGIAYLDTSGGANLTNVYAISGTLPVWLGAAVARTVRQNLTMLALIGSDGNLAVSNANSGEMTAGCTVAGSTITMYTRPGTFTINMPGTADLMVKGGTTSSWVNGGERDAIAGTNGSARTVSNTYTNASTLTSAKVHINYNAASSHRFYGLAFYFGDPGTQGRRDLSKWLRRICGLAYLDSIGYDIFLTAGQSNMMGVGDYTLSTTVPLGQGVEFLDSGCIKPMADPTQASCRDSENTALTGSLHPAFCAAYYGAIGRRACTVGGAYSGVGLLNTGAGPAGGWTAAGPLVADLAAKGDACVSYFQKVNSFSRIRGVLWAGGEQDATIGFTVNSYAAAVVDLRDRFRRATGIYSLPLYIISLDKSSDPPTETQYALIRQAQVQAASQNEGIFIVVPYNDYYDQGLTNGVHYNQAGLNTIGALAATNIAAMLA